MDKIEELLTRGVANIIPGKEDLKKALESGKKLNIYLGIDPTAPKIHLGHAVPFRKLQVLAELGHNVTLLIGDFTTLVGDTSDKDSERPILAEKEIEENFHTYKKQAEKLIDFSKVKLHRNSEWLSDLTYKEILKLKQKFTLNDFISRELIRKRLDAGKSVRLDETEYPIMQGYDSYFMDTDLQLGATDQTFNMQAGRTLQKILRNKESFIITTEFLDGTDGRKMSKSWGNAIWLNDEPDKMYSKIMAIKDDLIVQYFTLATKTPLKEIEEIKSEVASSNNPMPAKKKLAYEIVLELYNAEAANEAAANFKKIVQDKDLPIEVYTPADFKSSVLDIVSDLVTDRNRSEAKRLVEQNGVSVNEKKINLNDAYSNVKSGMIIKVGPRKIIKIKLLK